MARIVAIATDRGDLVLDPFLGSATTAAVAHKLGRAGSGSRRRRRRSSATRSRAARGRGRQDRGGISDAAGWEGGGPSTHLACFGGDGGLSTIA